jgi:uncharacterized protein YijF (DUF1287 family)
MRPLIFFCFILSINCSVAQDDLPNKLALAAIETTKHHVIYDPSYFRIQYPNGDVPADKGVCTDVIIRAYRAIGIDLQERVHEDMKKNFDKYPSLWGLTRPDTNIDHRRVPNLMKFFIRHGESLPTKKIGSDYLPGDIVTWSLANGLLHIGIVVNEKSADNERPLIVHNIGRGQEISDCLFSFTILGHYRYTKL